MKINTQADARWRGQALLKRMRTKGWRVEVWENLGWHFCLRRTGMSLYPNFDETKYHCGVNAVTNGIGFVPELISADFEGPNDAVADCVRLVREHVQRLRAEAGALDALAYEMDLDKSEEV